MSALEFRRSEPFTVGIELELQIVNRRDFDLCGAAADLLPLVAKRLQSGEVKPEITQSMLEISTSVHRVHADMLAELRGLRDAVTHQAGRLNLGITGGGAHPFQRWTDRRIFAAPRFHHLSELYGYLAKQFTVFGQHIHIGCENGDRAIGLIHAMSRYIPHFIALSASSPFLQGVDTAFESARLNSVNAFPLSGHLPPVRTWAEFEAYFDSMRELKVVSSMKDFYWDIRPKPEYGTIEVRVCDTPLTVERAAALAAFGQALARSLIDSAAGVLDPDLYRVYGYNRFLACRFGLEAELVDVERRDKVPLREDLLDTLRLVRRFASDNSAAQALDQLAEDVRAGTSDSAWLRETYRSTGSLGDVVRGQCEVWQSGRRLLQT
ncbi:MAG TPA: YbdK family carboxylate-amine ligase [Burkholderiales bacterium]|nr:YbdK family carboxylate-amine ligase [Burkholderiales bacterium]